MFVFKCLYKQTTQNKGHLVVLFLGGGGAIALVFGTEFVCLVCAPFGVPPNDFAMILFYINIRSQMYQIFLKQHYSNKIIKLMEQIANHF